MDDFITLTVLLIIALLIIQAFVAKKFEKIANMKGHTGYFWWCFWLGIVGYIMVLALPDRNGMPVGGTSDPAQRNGATGSQQDDSLPDL